MFQYVLFDLDGTLTDSKEGITRSAQYALGALGIEVENRDELERFIGPPLRESFERCYGLDERRAGEAVRLYRQRYDKEGWRENLPYAGIEEALSACKKKGMLTAVASSKPLVFVERILGHFGLRRYFDVVVGARLDGSLEDKAEVVEEALWQLQEITTGKGRTLLAQIFHPDNTAMVGDRCFDVEGGRRFRLYTLAVAYGYGSREELEAAGADRIVETVEELKGALLGQG